MQPKQSKAAWLWRRTGSLVLVVLQALAATAGVAALQSSSVEMGLSSLERQALGWMLMHRPSRPSHPEVAFVAVDTPLYEEREAPHVPPATPRGERPLSDYRADDCECPVPRICYALAIERLTRWGAAAVVIDIMFGRTYTETDRAEDERLGRALLEADRVVVPAVMQALALDRVRDPTITSDVVLSSPIPAVAFNAWEVGSPKVDPQNQEYAIELLQTAHDRDGSMVDYYSMPYLAFCRATDHPQEDLSPWVDRCLSGTVPRLLGDLFSRIDRGGVREEKEAPGAVDLITEGAVVVDEAFYQKRLLINFASGSNPQEGRYFPSRLSWLLGCSDEEGTARFRGKVVLIGNPAEDNHRTLVGALPGTEVLANAVQTLLEDRPLVPASNPVVLLVMFLAAMLPALAVRRLRVTLAAGATLVVLAALTWLSYEMLKRDIWFLVVTPVTAVSLSAGISLFVSSRWGQTMVARLIPERISRPLEKAGGFFMEEGTVLFSDIRGYSTFSEYADPAAIMAALNAYFGSVQDILDRYDGHFVKSPGDCVVAWFSEERRGLPHNERAIRAALELVENAWRFQDRWPGTDAQAFQIGVGINTGPMAIGLLDTRRHLEPTVIGDTVNLAARIESLTKQFGAEIVVSESTLEPVRHLFTAEALGETTVKGRDQQVKIFRVTGLARKSVNPPGNRLVNPADPK
jgi:class 3 adenylate cyclase/CHASE2 domain-containing sensor protein